VARILVGTSSWTDPTLLESGFYPESANTAEKRLRYYASRFSVVEVDSTYYGMPAEKTARLWVERTHRDFVFDIKSFSLFTNHPTQLRVLPKDLRAMMPPRDRSSLYYGDVPEAIRTQLWERFASAILPLDSAGKLGVVLFQFPEWFLPGRRSWEHILECRNNLPQYRIAVEFRNGLWVSDNRREETLRALRENGLAYVVVDEPQGFKSSVPALVEATADMAVVRFHGRNRENWEKKGITAAERFRYLYGREELEGWMPRLADLSSRVEEMHVLFNNCYRDYGVKNAGDIDLMMQSQRAMFPDYVPSGAGGADR
jgi:uncharacterized protein YecE (DUF72 family)